MASESASRPWSERPASIDVPREQVGQRTLGRQFEHVGGYPLVNVYVTMERSTIFNEKINYKWSFSIAMLVYQRVIHVNI